MHLTLWFSNVSFIIITLQAGNVTKVKCFSLGEKVNWNLSTSTMPPSLNQAKRVVPLLMIDTQPLLTTWTCSVFVFFCLSFHLKLILSTYLYHVMIIGYSLHVISVSVKCVWVFLPVCESVHHKCAMSEENRRGHQIPWVWSYRWFWAIICAFWESSSGPLKG